MNITDLPDINFRSELDEQVFVCNWISHHYPDVIFLSDNSGVKMSKGLAVKASKCKSDKGIDLLIFEPVNGYHGLLLELKKTGKKLRKKRDNTYINAHVKAQANTIRRLNDKGYYCSFAIGYKEAISIIYKYMKGEL